MDIKEFFFRTGQELDRYFEPDESEETQEELFSILRGQMITAYEQGAKPEEVAEVIGVKLKLARRIQSVN